MVKKHVPCAACHVPSPSVTPNCINGPAVARTHILNFNFFIYAPQPRRFIKTNSRRCCRETLIDCGAPGESQLGAKAEMGHNTCAR
jgi:hypothetical protein